MSALLGPTAGARVTKLERGQMNIKELSLLPKETYHQNFIKAPNNEYRTVQLSEQEPQAQ